MWHQYRFQLKPRRRGFHLVTDEILAHCPAIRGMRVGLMHVFIQHTSASLTLNENADPTVRSDFEAWFSRAVPDGVGAVLGGQKAYGQACGRARR